MPRVKRGTVRRAKRKKLLGLAKGYYANKSKLYRAAKESVDTALKYAFVGRRRKKRDFRRLWVVRINAAAREHGLTYGQLINGLKNAGDHARSQEPVRARDRQPGGVCDAGEAGQGGGEDRGEVGEERREGRRVEGRQRQSRGSRITTGTQGLGASEAGACLFQPPAPSF